MKQPKAKARKPPEAGAARRILTQQRRLVAEIEGYLEKYRELPGTGKRGLKQIEQILLDEIAANHARL